MATYTLVILIDSMVLEKQATDNLNIAKKGNPSRKPLWTFAIGFQNSLVDMKFLRIVNDVYTTTFHGASISPAATQQPLLATNTFEWTELYSAFLSVQYSNGEQISAATNVRPISFGQRTTYAKNMLTEPEAAEPAMFGRNSSPSDTFIVGDVPDNLHASVNCKVGSKWAPIYVDKEQHAGVMTKLLTPINQYALFWDKEVITHTMIDYSTTSHPYEFGFEPGQITKTLRFGYKAPDSPVGAEQPTWHPVSV
ncbi:MAG: hypothetical protein Q9164_001207 [Protoblastenia rupestris]